MSPADNDAMFDDNRTISRLTDRPTTGLLQQPAPPRSLVDTIDG